MGRAFRSARRAPWPIILVVALAIPSTACRDAARGASPFEVWDARFAAPAFPGTAPAGMVGIADAPGKNVAMPHGVDRDGGRRVLSWQSYDNMRAAGSVASSAAEMANWLRMQLSGGRFGGRTVLSEATVAEMHAPLVDAGTTFLFADSTAGTYGLGWSRTTFEGRAYISRGGSGDMEHWHHDVFRLYFDGGDGQVHGSSLVTFAVEPETGVTVMDLGFLGRYRRVP